MLLLQKRVEMYVGDWLCREVAVANSGSALLWSPLLLLLHLHPDPADFCAWETPCHTWLSALRETTTATLVSLLHLAPAAAERLVLFCTVLFSPQNCLWPFVLLLYYPGVLQAIKWCIWLLNGLMWFPFQRSSRVEDSFHFSSSLTRQY